MAKVKNKQQKLIKTQQIVTPTVVVDELTQAIRDLVERYKDKTMLNPIENRAMFDLYNARFPHKFSTNYNCSICSINIFNELKRI